MATMFRESANPVQVPESDVPLVNQIDELFTSNESLSTRVTTAGGVSLVLPDSVCVLLRRAVHELAQGNAVSVVPVQASLTTQQAADLLNVSRPFFVRLLDSGEIPHYRVGCQRRVHLSDVMAYKRGRSQERRVFFRCMLREAQEMDLYDE